jgi:hypothetical protein
MTHSYVGLQFFNSAYHLHVARTFICYMNKL